MPDDANGAGGKLLTVLTGRHQGLALVAAAKAAGARGGTIALGQTTSDSALLRALSLGDIAQDVVFILMGAEAGAVLAALRNPPDGAPPLPDGLAIVAAASSAPSSPSSFPSESESARNADMATPRQLITVIVNAGFGADVMDVARKAGATGGTLLSASGTGTAEDVKFFGVTLVPEKDMLMILADGDKAPSILSAIRTFPALSAPGGGIVYCVDVSEAFALGARADG